VSDDNQLQQLAALATAARRTLVTMQAEENPSTHAEEQDYEARFDLAYNAFRAAVDRAEMIAPVTPAGFQAKAGILLLVLEHIVATNIGETLEDVAKGIAGDASDKFSVALARDLVAWRVPA